MLNHLVRGRTTLVIAHYLSTIRRAEQIPRRAGKFAKAIELSISDNIMTFFGLFDDTLLSMKR